MDKYTAAETFIKWLENKILIAGRGDDLQKSVVEPRGKFWYGRLAPQATVAAMDMGDRGERLEPCAIGLKIRPKSKGPWTFTVGISLTSWRQEEGEWIKNKPLKVSYEIVFTGKEKVAEYCESEIRAALMEITGIEGLSAKVTIEKDNTGEGDELTVQLVNTSPDKHDELDDTRLYEAELTLSGVELAPFYLESLADSFRYERRIWAYGLNVGVEKVDERTIRTTDSINAHVKRPIFLPEGYEDIDLSFESLSKEPIKRCEALRDILKKWGDENWNSEEIKKIAHEEKWSKRMLSEADNAATRFKAEYKRLCEGIEYLRTNPELLKSFTLMNKAMKLAANKKYEGWRPFQIGFLLSNIDSMTGAIDGANTVDIVWFTTGGGKTETYLGLIVMAAFFDRLRGKKSGITAWSRFPLRMLSLQQTQRFANAMGAAEIIRNEAKIEGDPFSMGFFVGQTSTPNAIPQEASDHDLWDPDDPQMPVKLQVLESCPFCHGDKIEMQFNRKIWTLEHLCANKSCGWNRKALPFYIVDDEVYRFLPTVLVGTLDKAASISMQASMRGFIGAPLGRCGRDGHGYVYASRSKRPNGCLVPGCSGQRNELDQNENLYPPTLRLQDELHLLRDSLGAVDAHYEAVLDGLQFELTQSKSKILASSATLAGYQKQADVIYRRKARVFPEPGPKSNKGFWRSDSNAIMRNYVAVAPRGVTIEWTVDRLLTEIQRCIRRLNSEPEVVCKEAGIPVEHASFLVSIYGTNVVYGNTLRDIDAAVRSMETQVDVEGAVNTESLTGRTDFEHVREILNRLENYEKDFFDRIHLVSASSMMSHGVDVDRLNVMVMLGLPLSTSEFIQATARVGRKWPGLVFVIHKIGRERDASVFKFFHKYVEQGDRLLEPIPITRRSRRVLDRTIAGLIQSRMYHVHESKSSVALTTVKNIKKYYSEGLFNKEEEIQRLIEYLNLDKTRDDNLIKDISDWMENFIQNINNPPSDARFLSDLSPTGSPMRSLRDVEEQVPVIGSIF